uniref:Ankyrin n=1 Tax=Dechloromonas aromatica (strain RCB) TaxID=159087 RepID=Q47A32_DECAR
MSYSSNRLYRSIYILSTLLVIALLSPAKAESFLWDAVSKNDVDKAKTLISFGANVNQKNAYGNPIIHHAVAEGNLEIVELLISKGADVNAKGQFDRVALHYANKKGMAKTLLAHRAIVDTPTNYGETPLHWAASGVNGFGKQVDLVEFAEVLIANGADVNKKTGEGRSNKTPLNYAAESNNLPVAKILIAHGADVDGGGSSPLSSAGGNGDYVEMAQLLVEHGAGVNTPSIGGWYPLHSAAGRGNINVTNYLLAHGADPNATTTNRDKYTALYVASGSDYHAKVVESLLKSGANPNIRIANSLVPLHMATSEGAIKTVEVLLDHKAEINIATSDGTTPLHLGITLGKNDNRKDVVALLLKNGANVNTLNIRSGMTPLTEAINRNDVDIVKLLISNGADLNIMGIVGNKALAAARNSIAITDLLKEHGAHQP